MREHLILKAIINRSQIWHVGQVSTIYVVDHHCFDTNSKVSFIRYTFHWSYAAKGGRTIFIVEPDVGPGRLPVSWLIDCVMSLVIIQPWNDLFAQFLNIFEVEKRTSVCVPSAPKDAWLLMMKQTCAKNLSLCKQYRYQFLSSVGKL